MGYTLGESHNRPGRTGEILLIDSKSIITGVRAFVRIEASGLYREVRDLTQENMWVDNTNEGAWKEGPHETRDAAIQAASKAYRYVNKAA